MVNITQECWAARSSLDIHKKAATRLRSRKLQKQPQKMNNQHVGQVGDLRRMSLNTVSFIHNTTEGFRKDYESQVLQLYSTTNPFRQGQALALLVERLGDPRNILRKLNFVMHAPKRKSHSVENVIEKDAYGNQQYYFVRIIAGRSFCNERETARVLHALATVSAEGHWQCFLHILMVPHTWQTTISVSQ
jgi:hypothetical protein